MGPAEPPALRLRPLFPQRRRPAPGAAEPQAKPTPHRRAAAAARAHTATCSRTNTATAATAQMMMRAALGLVALLLAAAALRLPLPTAAAAGHDSGGASFASSLAAADAAALSASLSADWFVSAALGTDAPGCGAPLANACRSLRHGLRALEQSGAGATLWLDAGVYEGEQNGDAALQLANVVGPVHVRAWNGGGGGGDAGPARVLVDAAWQRRILNISVDNDSVGSSLQGITFSRALGYDQYGAVFVMGPDATAKLGGTSPAFSFINCTFEHNVVVGRTGRATTIPLAAGALVTAINLVGSATAAQHAAFVPGADTDPLPDGNSFLLPPVDQVTLQPQPLHPMFSPAYMTQPTLPTDSFQPGVIFSGCVFVNNSIGGKLFSTSGGAAAALAIDNSHGLVDRCTFRDHNPHPQTSFVVQASSQGATWIRDCTFDSNQMGPIVQNPLARQYHNLLVSGCVFRNNGINSTDMLAQPAALSGEVGASVVLAWGAGELTMIDNSVSDSFGIGINLASSVHGRFFGLRVTRHQLGAKNFMFLSACTMLFKGLHFSHNSGTAGLLLGRLTRQVPMAVVSSVFLSNRATLTGLFDVGGAPANMRLYVLQCHFQFNRAHQGVAIYSSDLTDASVQVVFQQCSIVNNAAARYGGIAQIQGGAVWFLQTTMTFNTAVAGGAVHAMGGFLQLWASSFVDNRAYQGGAIFLDAQATVHFAHTVFAQNSAERQGGAVYDAALTWANYTDCTFSLNAAANGAGIFFPALLQALDSNIPSAAQDGASDAVVSPRCSSALTRIVFSQNRASVFGGALMFDGPILPCMDFCGAMPTGAAIAVTSASDWTADKCRFVNNTADSGYGNNFASGLHALQLVQAVDHEGRTITAGTDAPADNLAHSDPSTPVDGGTLVIHAGLQVSFTVELLDELKRPFRVSGSGASGVTLQLLAFVNGRLLNPPLARPSTQIQTVIDAYSQENDQWSGEQLQRQQQPQPSRQRSSRQLQQLQSPPSAALEADVSRLGMDVLTHQAEQGRVTFTVRLFPDARVLYNHTADSASGDSTSAHSDGLIRLAVVADLTQSFYLSLDLHLESCPGAMLLSPVSDHGELQCIDRPSFVAGDSVNLDYNLPLVLLSLFVSVIAMWTSLILIEQIINAVGRGKNHVGWLCVCVCSFGFSGLWCQAIIAITSVRLVNSVTLASISFTLAPKWVMLSLAALVAFPFLGFMLVFTDSGFAAARLTAADQQGRNGMGRVRKYLKQINEPEWKQQNQSDKMSDDGSSNSGGGGSVNSSAHPSVHQPLQPREPRRQHQQQQQQTDAPVRSPTTPADPTPASPLKHNRVQMLKASASSASASTRSATATRAPVASKLTAAGGESQQQQHPSGVFSISVAPEPSVVPRSPQQSDWAAPAGSHSGCATPIPSTARSPHAAPAAADDSASCKTSESPAGRHFDGRAGAGPQRGDGGDAAQVEMTLTQTMGESTVEQPKHEANDSTQAAAAPPSATADRYAELRNEQEPQDLAIANANVEMRAEEEEEKEEAAEATAGPKESGSSSSSAPSRPDLMSFVLRQSVHARIFLGLALSFSGMVVGIVLMLSGILVDASFSLQFDGGILLAAICSSFVLFYPAMLMFLYLFSKLRMLSVFVMVGSAMLCQYAAGAAVRITYEGSESSADSGFDVSIMSLIAFAAAMVSSLVFVGINVVSLRLSRHQLGVVLRTMSDDLMHTHGRLSRAQRRNQMLTTWIDMSSRSKTLAGVRNRVVKRKMMKTSAAASGLRTDEDDLGRSSPLPGTCSTPTGERDTNAHGPGSSPISGGQAAAAAAAAGAQMDEAAEWVDLSGLVGLCALQGSGRRPGADGGGSWLSEDPDGAWNGELELLSRSSTSGAAECLSDRSSLVRVALHSLSRAGLLSPSLSGLSLAQLSASPPPLESVLAHPVCLALFVEHAHRTHNEDSLLCYSAIAQFRRTRPDQSALRLMLAAQIEIDYLTDGAEFEINISGPSKAAVRHTIRHQRPLAVGLFDHTQKELLTLIRTNLWLPFTHTRACLMSNIILDATQHIDNKRAQ